MIDIIDFMDNYREIASNSLGKYRLPSDITPLGGDKWIICSLLQKAIRRGDVYKAQQAAITLMQLDKRMLINRLRVICLEDIGVGDIATVCEVVSSLQYAKWRKLINGGEVKVLLWAVYRLAITVKDRTGDNIYGSLYNNDYKGLSSSYSKLKLSQLLQIVTSAQLPLISRIIASCYAGGTKYKSHPRLIDKYGDIEALFHNLGKLDIPPDYLQVCYHLGKNMNNLLPFILPLVAEQYNQMHTLDSTTHQLPESPEVDGIPLYALDTHTRIGKQAIDKLIETSPNIATFKRKHNITHDITKLIRLTLFKLESAPCNLTLNWELSKNQQREEYITNITTHGKLPDHLAGEFEELIKNEIPTLNKIRAKMLEEGLEPNNSPTLLCLV